MRQIFFLITVILLLNQNAIADTKISDSNLEEVSLSKNTSNKKIQSIEEITADLNAKKAASEPFNEKDVKVDVESLGLDSVDDKKVAEKPIERKSASIDIEGNQEADGNKILSKIQNFISGKSNSEPTPTTSNEVQKESKVDVITNSVNKSLIALKREKLRKRIAEEKKKAAIKKEKERKEAKEIRLNKLRKEYLLKLKNNEDADELPDEDFTTNSKLILPKEKSFRWSDRFISYDPPALPILDRYRGNDNKHIPVIPTIQEKIDAMFQIINSNNPAYFNSSYQHVLDPNIRNANGETILTYATLFQKYGVMSSILAKGADPDLPNALGHTPLNIAIEMLDMKSAQILIDMNADPNYVNGLGRTYLMYAARAGFLPMVDLLISHGVDIDAIDNDGFTALTIAYKYKKDVIVKFLLKSGAKPWVKKPYDPDKQSLIKELEGRWGNKNSEKQNEAQK